jgi:predicted esterase
MSPRAAVLLSLSLFACNPGNPPVGPPPGPGLGQSCAADGKCKTGFTCSATTQTCEGARATADGSACTYGVECVSGHCAPSGTRGTCAAAGTGALGTACQGDANCEAGLKCGFNGETLFPRCLTAGTKDLGAECSVGLECAQGLLCVSGVCATASLPAAMAPNGYPPVLPQAPGTGWQGASCPMPKSAAQVALWSLPRDTDDLSVRQDFYRLPFPNDALRDSNGRIDFSRHPKDPSPSFGFDVLGRYLDALAPEPFSNSPTAIFRFDGPIDFSSIMLQGATPNVRLIKLEQNMTYPHGLTLVLNGAPNRYVCANWLAIRPFEGESLSAGTWAVLLFKGLRGQGMNGAELTPSADFSAMMSATAPTEARQALAWPAYAKLRDTLATMNVNPNTLLAATVFTVDDPQRLVKRLARSVATAPTPTAGMWVKCGSGAPSPCSDSTGPRACGTANADFDEWHALLDLPIFQQGTAPYLTPTQGGAIEASGAVVRTEQVCASLTVPTGTPPTTGWPVVIYAHGTGGNFRGHAGDGSAAAAARITLPGVTEPVRAAVLGFDQVGHGPRRGTAGQSTKPEDIVFNFANPASARGTMAQGAADLHAVTKYVKSLATNAPAELPPLDVSRLVFWGHSQGATEGALFLAQDRSVEGTLLSGASAQLVESLTSKKQPINIADGLWLALNESNPSAVSTYHPVLALLQAWTDPVDPVHFARQASVVPAEGMTPAFARHVFQVWGKDDLFTPRTVQSSFARAARLGFVGPQVDDYDAMPATSVSGNVMRPRVVTAAMRQYVPPTGTDGHFVVFSNAAATTDASRFIGRVLRGETPTIPEP